MAMIAQLVLLSLSVQSLLATNGTTPAVNESMSTVPEVTETVGSTESVSIETTEAPATSNLTDPTVSTSSTASTSTLVATGSKITTLEPSTETRPTTVMTTPPSSPMPTDSGTTTPPGGGTTMVVAGTTGMTSSLTQAVTSESSGGLMTTSATIKMTTKGGPGSDGVSLAVYIAAGVVSGLVVLVIIFAIVVWCIRSRKSQAGSGSRNPFGLDEMDKLDPKDRMSVHRPVSASVNASDDLSFVTFNTGAAGAPASATASAEYHVGGIENPTYALSNVSEEEESADGEEGHQDGAATMPSQAHLGIARPTEGAVGSESGKKSYLRPLSGVSYTSNDLEGALETLDIIAV